MKVLQDNGKKLKYIVHGADIHIKSGSKHVAEYKHVFNKFYAELKKMDPEETICVIVGDIFDQKCIYDDHSINLFLEFVTEVSSTMPLILCLGNHDGLFYETKKRETISKLVAPFKNVWCLLESNYYVYNSIIIGLSSVYDRLTLRGDIDAKDKYKIGLFHGQVNDTMTPSKGEKNNAVLNCGDFENYHITLLGDTHKYKTMKDKKGKDLPICYSSSMTQQGYNESTEDHGFVLWKLSDKSKKYIRLPNEYGQITVTFKDDVCVDIPKYIPKTPKVRCICIDTSQLSCETEIKKLIPNYSRLDYVFETTKLDGVLAEYQEKNKVNIHELKNQIKYLKEYLTDELNITDEKEIDDIIKIHTKIHNDTKSCLKSGGVWKIESLKFANITSYGKLNEIDFLKLPKIVGITGKNGLGKSSISDCILYTLYGKCSKGERILDVMNIRSSGFISTLIIRMNNKRYKIIRGGGAPNKTKDPNNEDIASIRMQLKLYEEIDEEFSELTGSSVTDTTNKIKELFGDYDQITSTVFKLQKSRDITDLTDTQLFMFFLKLRNMEFFSEYKTQGNKLLKEWKDKCKIDTANMGNNNIDDLQKSIDEKTRLFEELTIDYEKSNEIIESLHNKLNVLYSNKSQTSKFSGNIDKLKKEKRELLDKIKLLEMKKVCFIDRTTDIAFTDLQIERFNQILRSFDDLNLDEIVTNNEKIINDLTTKKLDSDLIDKLVQKLKNNNTCVENYKQKIDTCQKINDINNKKNDLIDMKSNNLIKKNEICQVLSKLNSRLNSLNGSISGYDNNSILLEQNKKLDAEIYILKEEIVAQKNINKKINKEQMELNATISKMTEYIKTFKESSAKFKEHNYNYMCCEKYVDAISPSGVPFMLMKPTMKMLEINTNKILAGLTDFKINFEANLSEKKKIKVPVIDIFMVKNNYKYSVSKFCGWEGIIINMAMRIGVNSITNAPRPDFCILDEAFSQLDSDNLQKVDKVFDILKSNFATSLIVTHLNEVKSECQILLDIKQNDDLYSQLQTDENNDKLEEDLNADLICLKNKPNTAIAEPTKIIKKNIVKKIIAKNIAKNKQTKIQPKKKKKKQNIKIVT